MRIFPSQIELEDHKELTCCFEDYILETEPSSITLDRHKKGIDFEVEQLPSYKIHC